MADRQTTVEAAIRRWQSKGLVSPELADTLVADTAESSERTRRRLGQYAVAGTGGLLLLIAAAVFFAWSWPQLGAGARAVLIAAVGVVAHWVGLAMEKRHRWVPVAYALQTAGLSLLLAAYAYSEEAWPNQSVGGVLAGLLALATPLVMAPVFIRRNPVMPAIATALGYLFLFVFFERTVGLDEDQIIWILDGVLAASVLIFAVRMARHSEKVGSSWELGAFVASLYAGFVLVFVTALGPLSLGDDAVWALDLWLAAVTALTLLGIHMAPPPLQRGWYRWQLSLSMVIAVVLAFWTMEGALNASTVATTLVVATLGAVGLWYALQHGVEALIMTSCFALVVAAWFLGVAESGAIGAALALGFTAVVFFWVAGKIGRERDAEEDAGVVDQAEA